MIILLMGVSGSGKTTIGELLAQRLSCSFEDADDYHSQENKSKMKAGIALTDSDRRPWLAELSNLIKKYSQSDTSVVLACSALKESYRKIFYEASENLVVVYLKVDFETTAARLAHRHHEFMNADLLKSQFETLEEPTSGRLIVVDADNESIEEIVDEITIELKRLSPSS